MVEVAPDTAATPPTEPVKDAPGYYCGGLPMFSEVQDVDRFGTLGCLVTGGRTVYALTAGHVAGLPGSVSRASLDDNLAPIGVADECQVARKPFEQLYPTLSQASV